MASRGVLVVFMLLSCYATRAAKQGRTYKQFYKEAVDSYLTERWYECASLMQKAVQDYKTFTNKFAECDADCGETVTRAVDQPKSAIDFYDITIRKAGCTRKCLQKHFPNLKLERDEVDEAFDTLLPYDYWQMCAYKVGGLSGKVHQFILILVHHVHSATSAGGWHASLDWVLTKFYACTCT